MPMQFYICAVRQVMIADGKQKEQKVYFPPIQPTTTKVCESLIADENPIGGYIRYVLQCMLPEQKNYIDVDGNVCTYIENDGPAHVTDLINWIMEMEKKGYSIETESM